MGRWLTTSAMVLMSRSEVIVMSMIRIDPKLKNADMANAKQKEQVLQSRERLLKKAGTKSEAIRQLYAAGWSRTEIAEFLDLRYQHVRTVLITPLTSKGESVKHGPN